jgi:hypothetical protein
VSETGRESLRLNLEKDALFRFFEALERERRQIGIVGVTSRIEPRRRASLVELVLTLNLESAWPLSETPIVGAAVMTQMFAPLLAETAKARDALRRALEASPPGAFNFAIPERRDSGNAPEPAPDPTGPVRRTFRPQAWAAALAAFTVAVVIVAYAGMPHLSLSCLFRECATRPPIVPEPAPPNVRPRPRENPPAEKSPVQQSGKDVYAQFLRTVAQSLASRNSLLTPRELAQDFAAADPAGPSAEQILEGMFAAAPRHPDLALPTNAEGAADLRRYAAAAAAVVSQKDLEEMLDLATSGHDDEGQKSNEKPMSEIFADFAKHAASAPAYRRAAPTNESPIHWVPFAAACLALVGVLAAIWRTLSVQDARLNRALGDIKGERADLRVQAVGIESIDAPQFAEIVNQMSRRHPVDGRRLDPERTIRASVAQLGMFSPIFKPKSVSPEYVFLLKRDARDDHARDRFAAIVDALRLAGVRATRYDFSHDPRILFPDDDWEWQRALPLRLLSDRHPDARLILVSDGVELVAPANLQPFAWLRSLNLWRDVGLLTPAVVREEGSAAQSLALSLGWPTNQARLSGLAGLVDHFDSKSDRPGALDAGFRSRIERPLPASILNSRTRLLSDAALDPAGQETLVADLRYFLGNQGFYWLASTAIYPELRYDITIFLGLRLTEGADPNRPAVFNDDRLTRLASLPWFQVGRFPDWIRRLLFDSIRPEEQRQAQDEVTRMLEGAWRGDDGSRTEEFDAAAILGAGEPRPTKIPLSIWRRESQGAAIPRDSVTLELLTRGGRTDLLRPVTGHTFEEIRAAARRSRWAERASILLPALAWILAFIWLVPKPWSGSATTGAWFPVLSLSATAALALIVSQWSRLWQAVATAPAAAATAVRRPASTAAEALNGGKRW